MTKLPDLDQLRVELIARFGLGITVSAGETADGTHVDIRPDDLHENAGFSVRTVIGWRHITARLHVGNFAADLLTSMSAADADQRARFRALASLATARNGLLSMSVNGRPVSPSTPGEWPGSWTAFSLSVERTPLLVDHEDPEALYDQLLFWGGNLFGMVVALLTVEEIGGELDKAVRGLPEGAVERVLVNKYERNRINRTLCIENHGARCCVCGFDFFNAYGSIGRGFIHVHHVVPVSLLGPGYVIDPAVDLVPVCPNCHAMLHRQSPPLDVLALRAEIAAHRG